MVAGGKSKRAASHSAAPGPARAKAKPAHASESESDADAHSEELISTPAEITAPDAPPPQTTLAIATPTPQPVVTTQTVEPAAQVTLEEIMKGIQNINIVTSQTNTTVQSMQNTINSMQDNLISNTNQLAEHARQLEEQATRINNLQEELAAIKARPPLPTPTIQDDTDDANWPRISSTSRWTRRSLSTPPGLRPTDPSQHHSTEDLPFPDADAIIIGGFPDKTPKEARIKAATDVIA